MKRILLFICFAACLIAMVATTVVAHPGRTDSQGGHTDQSTGEYHFHHGYSAHDHYDMNGDGVVDCPYEFDDKTNHDGGGYGYTRPTEKVEQETEEVKVESEEPKIEVKKEPKKKVTMSDVLAHLMFAAFFWVFASYAVFWVCAVIFKSEQGCAIGSILGAVIAIIAAVIYFSQ